MNSNEWFLKEDILKNVSTIFVPTKKVSVVQNNIETH